MEQPWLGNGEMMMLKDILCVVAMTVGVFVIYGVALILFARKKDKADER